MRKYIPMTTVFGRLTVIKNAEWYVSSDGKRHAASRCQCECGTECVVRNESLKNGNTRSCGCLSRETTTRRATKHGVLLNGRTPREYFVWAAMRNRCENPDSQSYAAYGGRGIRVCERWQSVTAFIEDMGCRPTPNHSIERINNDGHYEPSNCRWATRKEQANNRRNSRLVTINNITRTATEWAGVNGISSNAVRNRLRRSWPAEQAVTLPVCQHKRQVHFG